MIKSEIVIDQHYKDFSPMQFGSETCDPGHFFGPSVRTHWLLHYIVYGFGRFERDGISYSVKPGDIFVIPPYKKTYYEADQKKPWRYIWIGFTTDQSVPEQLLKPIIHCPSAGKIFEEMLQCEKMEKVRQVAAVDIQAISDLPDRDAIDILSIDAVDCLLHIISVRFCIVQQDTKKFPQLCA